MVGSVGLLENVDGLGELLGGAKVLIMEEAFSSGLPHHM